jgi:hypothetical protein
MSRIQWLFYLEATRPTTGLDVWKYERAPNALQFVETAQAGLKHVPLSSWRHTYLSFSVLSYMHSVPFDTIDHGCFCNPVIVFQPFALHALMAVQLLAQVPRLLRC